MLTLAVLISGGGSNLRALLEETRHPDFPARVVVVGADRDAQGLFHAEDFDIPSFTVPYSSYETREQWGEALIEQLARWNADVVVLSGLMRLLPRNVLDRFAPHIINTHPAYLPEFPGAHAVRDALAAGATETGASVIVVDGGVDSGPVLRRERVAIPAGTTEAELHDAIKLVERRLLSEVVVDIATEKIRLEEYRA